MTRWARVSLIGCSHSLEETDADGDPIGTSQEATAEPSANDAKRDMAIRTVCHR